MHIHHAAEIHLWFLPVPSSIQQQAHHPLRYTDFVILGFRMMIHSCPSMARCMTHLLAESILTSTETRGAVVLQPQVTFL